LSRSHLLVVQIDAADALRAGGYDGPVMPIQEEDVADMASMPVTPQRAARAVSLMHEMNKMAAVAREAPESSEIPPEHAVSKIIISPGYRPPWPR